MLQFNLIHTDWLKAHKKEIWIFVILCGILTIFLGISSAGRSHCLIKEDGNVIAINREFSNETVSVPLEIQAEKDGRAVTCEAVLILQGPAEMDAGADSEESVTTENMESETDRLENAVLDLVSDIENSRESEIILPRQLEDGTSLQWKHQKNHRFLLIWLLMPAGLLYLYETERQREKDRRKREEEEIRQNLPSFADQLLLLLNCGMIFHDAFYRIESGRRSREEQDAFSRLLSRIRREADETGSMVITVMKGLSQEVAIREYVRMVNIMVDHQHRGVNLEEKLQAESRLLWEGRKAAAMQKGKEMETKMTFPLAMLLVVLILIAGVPALMNM